MSMTGKHVLKAYLHDLVRAFLIYEPEVARAIIAVFFAHSIRAGLLYVFTPVLQLYMGSLLFNSI